MSSSWFEMENVVSCTVISDGTTGKQWIDRLKKKEFDFLTFYTAPILLSSNFIPTTGITTEIVILKGRLWYEADRTLKNVYKHAKENHLLKPNLEIACLLREKFSYEDMREMGISYLYVMHEPAECLSDSRLLGICRNENKDYLCSFYANPNTPRSCSSAFAFSVGKNEEK